MQLWPQLAEQTVESLAGCGGVGHLSAHLASARWLVWSSDYPHWDFDLPSVIYDLPFLKEGAKRNILGGNAARLFGLDPKPVKKTP